MDLLDKFEPLKRARAELEGLGIDPFNVVVSELLSPTEAVIWGRRVILAGTNNYLGLTFHPECLQAAREALEREGCGTTGSRMANGNYCSHLALERELAEFYGKPYGMIFSTGYQTNLALLSGLAGPGDVLLIDSDAHASIYDGCRLSGADTIRFRHNDLADLEKRLRRLKERTQRTLIVVEGIYSMLGDRAPLAGIVELKERYGAYLLVDEAHALGVLGEGGRGLCEEAGVLDRVDFITGTFSKSLAGIGGYAVSHHDALPLLRYTARPYIFTAAPSPPQVASVRKALQIVKTQPELRERLWENAERLYNGFKAMGLEVGPELTPIVAVLLTPDRHQAIAIWAELLERGVYVNLMLPPATPSERALLRCSLSAAHTQEQIDQILELFHSVFRERGLLLA